VPAAEAVTFGSVDAIAGPSGRIDGNTSGSGNKAARK
jgi:hypothetical protein